MTPQQIAYIQNAQESMTVTSMNLFKMRGDDFDSYTIGHIRKMLEIAQKELDSVNSLLDDLKQEGNA